MHGGESGRLRFLERRDGRQEARRFALRTLRLYRQAVLNPHHFAATPDFRATFVRSYLCLKRYCLGDREASDQQ